MQKYYDKSLSVSVLYKEPLFLSGVKFKENTNKPKVEYDKKEVKGARYNSFDRRQNYIKLTERLLHAVHSETSNAVLLLRAIASGRRLDKFLVKPIKDNPLDLAVKFILGNHQIIHFPFSKGKETIPENKYIIIAEYNEDEDSDRFLPIWRDFYFEWTKDSLEYVNARGVKNKLLDYNYKIIGQYTPTRHNHTVLTYYLLKEN